MSAVKVGTFSGSNYATSDPLKGTQTFPTKVGMTGLILHYFTANIINRFKL